MLKLIQGVQQQLSAFVDQDQKVALIASCGDSDVGMLLKILRDMDQASEEDLYLLFADPFEELSSYVEVTIERLRAEHCLADEALLEEGEQQLPPMPEELLDETRPPAQRLHEAIVFARSLLPGSGHRLVWAMAPVAIQDRAGYLGLLSTLVPEAEGPRPWMAGTRLILRDEADTPLVAPQLVGAPLTRALPLDLGPEAMERSMEQEMEDEQLPLEQRMQSMLSLAFLDYAHKRYPQALEKYNFLLGYYQGVDNKALQALVLCGMGDIYHREAQLDQARQWYENAVPPAAQGDSPVIFFSVVNNLGDVAYEQGRYGDAEQLYDSAEQLATHLGDPEGKARMLERRGLSQEQQRRAAEAARSFEDAAMLCRGVGLDPQLRDNLGHLERIYGAQGMRQQLEAARAERRALEQRLEEQRT